MYDRRTGSKMKPLAMPNVIMPNQALKNTRKMYDLEGPSITIARKVEKPPWKILDPIYDKAFLILYSRFSVSFLHKPGGGTTTK